MERTYVSDIKSSKEYLVYGWVSEIRNLGSIKFILLRDKTGIIQVIAIKDKTKSEIFEQFSKLTKESVIEVKGKAVENKKAPNGIELIPINNISYFVNSLNKILNSKKLKTFKNKD